MRVLVLGGTVFLGRAVVAAALDRGWDVTILHRGVHNAQLFGGRVDRRLGDRREDLAGLLAPADPEDDPGWDLVVDTSGYDPPDVRASVAALRERAARYVFVSSLSAYAHWPARAVDERAPLYPPGGEGYGARKADCERAVRGGFGTERSLCVRPGVIVGPYEHIGRLPRWLRRFAHGGWVLVPGPPDAPVQLVDARDLAAWMLDTLAVGAVNAVGPTVAWGELIRLCHEQAATSAEPVWAGADWTAARVEDPWNRLPLWPPPGFRTAGLYATASRGGPACRPLAETVADTWAWLRRAEADEAVQWRVDAQVEGLSLERERELLDELGKAGAAESATPASLSVAHEAARRGGGDGARRSLGASPRRT